MKIANMTKAQLIEHFTALAADHDAALAAVAAERDAALAKSKRNTPTRDVQMGHVATRVLSLYDEHADAMLDVLGAVVVPADNLALYVGTSDDRPTYAPKSLSIDGEKRGWGFTIGMRFWKRDAETSGSISMGGAVCNALGANVVLKKSPAGAVAWITLDTLGKPADDDDVRANQRSNRDDVRAALAAQAAANEPADDDDSDDDKRAGDCDVCGPTLDADACDAGVHVASNRVVAQ